MRKYMYCVPVPTDEAFPSLCWVWCGGFWDYVISERNSALHHADLQVMQTCERMVQPAYLEGATRKSSPFCCHIGVRLYADQSPPKARHDRSGNYSQQHILPSPALTTLSQQSSTHGMSSKGMHARLVKPFQNNIFFLTTEMVIITVKCIKALYIVCVYQYSATHQMYPMLIFLSFIFI
jgi:hypothetical protein